MSGLKKTGHKLFWIIFISLLLPFADACSSDEDKEDTIDVVRQTASNPAGEEPAKSASEDKAVKQAPDDSAGKSESVRDRRAADQIMAFNNHALARLQNDWQNPAEMFYNLGHIYLRIFKIPATLDVPPRKRRDLIPPAGLFDEQEERALYHAMDNMDKALASSLTHFGQLKTYVLDPAIQDNGRNGRKIVGMLEQDYKAFRKACKAWQKILEKKVDAAEKTLLANHPLQRQALAASSIMRIINSVAVEINSSDLDRQALSGDALKINSLIANAKKPPFPARPSLERLYRIFLNNASIYAETLGRTALEGAYDIQKRELSLAARASSDSYNDFVTAFNEDLAGSRKAVGSPEK